MWSEELRKQLLLSPALCFNLVKPKFEIMLHLVIDMHIVENQILEQYKFEG